MSYARWFAGHSDVYVYAASGGGIVCCGCFLTDHYQASTSGEMIAHLQEHLANGHLVPRSTIEDIAADYPDLDAEITDEDDE